MVARLVDALRAEGVDITAPDLIIGTSAGACVGAHATNQLAAALALQDSDSEIYVPARAARSEISSVPNSNRTHDEIETRSQPTFSRRSHA
jgi:predicted acylesterase/phospholipase RssA